MLRANLPELSRQASMTVEGVCLLVLLLELLLRAAHLGMRSALRANWHGAKLLLIVLAGADLVWSAAAPQHLRLSPVLRPALFVMASARIRSLFRSLARTLPKILEVLLLVALLVAFYAVMGVFMFKDFHSSSAEAAAYFGDLSNATTNMLVLLTTANYPGPALLRRRPVAG